MIILATYLNLDKIAESGQCFRWKKTGEQAYQIPAFGKVLNARHVGANGEVELDCSLEDFRTVWEDYFDLKTPYEQYEQELRTRSDTGEYLYRAAGDSEAKDLIESVIEELEMGGPIEGAST